jgi:hypothetical protein
MKSCKVSMPCVHVTPLMKTCGRFKAVEGLSVQNVYGMNVEPFVSLVTTRNHYGIILNCRGSVGGERDPKGPPPSGPVHL